MIPVPRTDLSTTYTLTPEQREAQGYLSRSEWDFDLTILADLLRHALTPAEQIDWQLWSVEAECWKLRTYHFEDLDMHDQRKCAVAVEFLEDALGRLEGERRVETRRLDCVREVVVLYRSFADQARQLYGSG